ncbi:MAG TPA: pyridoxal phosphate-dependent aminotransferase [Alphaproteobacteria bacterium]|nr:pyridoxal phosphate-dependent aminotransferase [Alphaproteobacteria bacterium]
MPTTILENTISLRSKNVKPSPTLAIMQQALSLQASGIKILNLSTGEPDFDTPVFIKEAAIKAINAGQTKYTTVDGTTALKNAIINKFKRENNLIYEIDEITVGAGGKQVIFNAFMATINAGDEVIIPTPYWVSYPDIVRLVDGIPVFVEGKAENQLKITPQQLDDAINPRTKWIVLNSPSNPSGSMYSTDEIYGISQVLRKHKNSHVHILSDDIYEHLIYEKQVFATIAQIEPSLKPRTLTVNGVSKTYCMTGWRIGYGGGPKSLIKTIGMIQSQSTSNPSSISQAAAVEALNGPQDFIAPFQQAYKKRRDFVANKINKTPGLSCLIPPGAFYLYVSCAGLIGKKFKGKVITDDTEFCKMLLEFAKVAVVPGNAFGLSPYFRISYATSDTVLAEACDQINQFCLGCS